MTLLEWLEAPDPRKRAVEGTKQHILYLRDRMHREAPKSN